MGKGKSLHIVEGENRKVLIQLLTVLFAKQTVLCGNYLREIYHVSMFVFYRSHSFVHLLLFCPSWDRS